MLRSQQYHCSKISHILWILQIHHRDNNSQQWSLSWNRWIQSKICRTIFISILILPSHVRRSIQSGPLLTKPLYALLFHSIYSTANIINNQAPPFVKGRPLLSCYMHWGRPSCDVFCASTNWLAVKNKLSCFLCLLRLIRVLWLVLHMSWDKIGVLDWKSIPMFATVPSWSWTPIIFCTCYICPRQHSVTARCICRVHKANDEAWHRSRL